MRQLYLFTIIFTITTSWAFSKVDTAKFLKNGETLTYMGSAPRLSILGENIGSITITTKEDKLISKKKCFKINLVLKLSKAISGIYTYGALISSVLEYNNFRFLVYTKNDRKKDMSQFEKALVDYDEKNMQYMRYRQDQKITPITIPTPYKEMIDPLSLIYYLRTLDLSKVSGNTKKFTLFNRGRISPITLNYRRTTITLNKKKVPVIHIKPSKATKGSIIRKRDVELYLDPATKIPLLIKILGIPVIGSLELKLKK